MAQLREGSVIKKSTGDEIIATLKDIDDSGFLTTLPTHHHDDKYYTEIEIDAKLNGKVDNSKVLTNVPANAKFTDTVYTHPSTHPASIVTESATKRFVSDAEKTTWNGKAEINDIPTNTSQLTNDSGFLTTLPEHNHDILYEPKNSNIQSHISNTSNPHSTTKSQVGLGSVSNYGVATQSEAEVGTSNSKYMTPLRTKQAIDNTNTIHVGNSEPSNRNNGWVDTSL